MYKYPNRDNKIVISANKKYINVLFVGDAFISNTVIWATAAKIPAKDWPEVAAEMYLVGNFMNNAERLAWRTAVDTVI